MADKLLIVHGYSDGSTSFTGLRDFFVEKGCYRREDVYFIDYSSMDDETTYEDLADKLETDYRNRFPGQRIDVACHSTGSLVVRAWLALHNQRGFLRDETIPPCPVDRMLCFAPANFGSDLAVLGQSFLSKFRCTFFNNSRPEDTFESGKVLLHGLEPASPWQWKLSMLDLHHENTYFSPNRDPETRCYPFILAAGTGYTGLQAKFIKARRKPGTDGTVRISGTSLNTRCCRLDFRDDAPPELIWYPEFKFSEMPFAVCRDFNHGSIIDPTVPGFSTPHGPGALALEALTVKSSDDYERVGVRFRKAMETHYSLMTGDDCRRFQQFFFKIRDDVDQPVPDYYVDFYVVENNGRPNEDLTLQFDEYFQTSFYRHSVDPSHRVMLVDCSRLEEFDRLLRQHRAKLMIQINGVSPLPDVQYRQQTFEAYDPEKEYDIYFLCPNTTTLVDIVLNREQSDRMLQLKTDELQPLTRIVRSPEPVEAPGGRAALLRTTGE